MRAAVILTDGLGFAVEQPTIAGELELLMAACELRSRLSRPRGREHAKSSTKTWQDLLLAKKAGSSDQEAVLCLRHLC
jgi:hypothetical protein